MSKDGWKSYSDFKKGSDLTEHYYDLVRTVFEAGVKRACGKGRKENALDLGCGSGELTRRLRAFANHVTGVDSSPGLIEKASSDPDMDNLTFVLADVLDDAVIGELPSGGFDLITAAWLHNHLGTEEDQRKLLQSILRLSKPDGRFVFLIPGLGFTTQQAQLFFNRLGWRQAWLDDNGPHKYGVYRFSESPWQELWVWQPLWLARLYAPHFEISFLDVKGLSIDHEGLGDEPMEPPFEVMMGWRNG